MRIEAWELCKSFTRLVNDKGKKSRKEEFFAVDHVDIDAREGEILGVLGPNGAGKTTLLRMLGTLLEPGSGSVHIIDDSGEEISDPIRIKNCIGYLSENTRLYGRLSTRELMQTIGEVYGMEAELREMLNDGDGLLSDDLVVRAQELGISDRTLKIAKKNLGVISERRGGRWYSVLPVQEGKGAMS